MSDITVTRNHDGAWIVHSMCSDGRESFLETMRYYDYTRNEAVSLFKQYCEGRGYKILSWRDEV
jgi:hypothetical protein